MKCSRRRLTDIFEIRVTRSDCRSSRRTTIRRSGHWDARCVNVLGTQGTFGYSGCIWHFVLPGAADLALRSTTPNDPFEPVGRAVNCVLVGAKLGPYRQVVNAMLWLILGVGFAIFAAFVIVDAVMQSKQTHNRDRH